MRNDYAHLPHIESHDDLTLYELIPDVVWIFDLDKHGWWWGNEAAIKFWSLETVDDLINKDLSGDTQGARDRTKQTFDLAAKEGLTIDPWTTYPGGKPKTLYMKHRACLVGPDKHRAIIAYINEEVNLGDVPENLLLVEAMRYTTVLVTTFTLEGHPVIENPAATEAYKSINPDDLPDDLSPFAARFADIEEGQDCLNWAKEQEGGRRTCLMKTDAGLRRHTLDIRMTRHPLTGDFLLMMAEYDVSDLHEALDTANEAQEELRRMAHYDALTGLPSLCLLQERAEAVISNAERHRQKVAVMFVDLDGFKAVNDNWGHEAGDIVLKEVAQRMLSVLRDADQVARIGGDEFLMMVTDVTSRDDATRVARKLIDAIGKPILLNEAPVYIGASIGISFYPDHGGGMEDLIKSADAAMYRVKKSGKNNFECMEE